MRFASITAIFVLVIVFSCSKNGDTTLPSEPDGDDSSRLFTYPDSVYYLREGDKDYMASPLNGGPGLYYGFPDGILVDEKTGVIDIAKSETGLRYVVYFIPQGTADTLHTFVTISGINYLDGFYDLSKGDSIINPVYNGNPALAVPGINNGSLFDIGSGCNNLGCNVAPDNASINLAQTVRNGVFGDKPANNDRQEFELVYQISDKSANATNRLKVKLYYFDSMEAITPEAYDIINSRAGTIIAPGTDAPPFALQLRAAKPRPPCIFIVGGR